jgi:hypothetical protein
MSSFPEDTQEEVRLVGERGVQDAGTPASTGMVDRLKPHLPTLRQDKLRSRASKPTLS